MRHEFRFRQQLRLGLATLACAAVVSGCLLLHPDADTPVVMLRIVASPRDVVRSVALGTEGTSQDAPLSGPCSVPSSLLCEDSLTAVARVWLEKRTPVGTLVDRLMLAEGSLAVGPAAPVSCERVLTGSIGFEAGGASDTYRIEVDLLYRGDDVRGLWKGRIELDSGLTGSVDTLLIRDLEAQIVVSWFEFVGRHVFPYTYKAHEFSASYAAIVDWQGYPQGREVKLTMTGMLQPTAIFTGSVTVRSVRPGSEPQEVLVPIFPDTLSPRFPGDVGERFVAALEIFFTDGGPPQESGSLEVTRQVCAGP